MTDFKTCVDTTHDYGSAAICLTCFENAVRHSEALMAYNRVMELLPKRVITAGGIGYCDGIREAARAAGNIKMGWKDDND